MNVARECARAARGCCTPRPTRCSTARSSIYYEHDPPTPPNWYGQTKARAERAIGELLPSAAIVRLSLVLGRGALPAGNSYLEKVIGNLQAGNQIVSPDVRVSQSDRRRHAVRVSAGADAAARRDGHFPHRRQRQDVALRPGPRDRRATWAAIRALIVPQTRAGARPRAARPRRFSGHRPAAAVLPHAGSHLPARSSKGLSMQLPKAIYELEFNHGSIYGDEEAAALVEVLKASAPSCGPQGQGVRRGLRRVLRHPARPGRHLGHRGPGAGDDRLRGRTGRRSHHHAA